MQPCPRRQAGAVSVAAPAIYNGKATEMSDCIRSVLDLIKLVRSGELAERWLEAFDLVIKILSCVREFIGGDLPPMVGAAEIPETLEGVCSALEEALPSEDQPETVSLGPVAIALIAKLAELVIARIIDRLVK